jgi:hypothetical protein
MMIMFSYLVVGMIPCRSEIQLFHLLFKLEAPLALNRLQLQSDLPWRWVDVSGVDSRRGALSMWLNPCPDVKTTCQNLWILQALLKPIFIFQWWDSRVDSRHSVRYYIFS